VGKLVVTEFISLDGVIEDPGGAEAYEHGGWTFRFNVGEGYAFKGEELASADAQLLGRVTYEGFAKAWPERSGDEFSDRFNAMPKYVVSTTLHDAEWNNSHVLSSIDEVPALKERYEGDILLAGSAQLAQSLLAADLVDQLNLMVFPVLLGSGKRLFADDTDLRRFTVEETRQVGDVVIIVLRRERESEELSPGGAAS
jgi:dihydrofolate reductase